MLIQCKRCQSTYNIDERKIPDKKAFVRCSKCSEPIPLDRADQRELSKQQPKKIVKCESCGIGYSIPLEKLRSETVKVRCGKCGHLFSVSKSDSDAKIDEEMIRGRSPKTRVDTDRGEKDRKPFSDNEDVDLDNISIPDEHEIKVDDLFNDIDGLDDFDDERQSADGSDSSENLVDEYLESVSLQSSEGDDDDLDIGEISKEQKYKIFLKPSDKKEGSEANETDNSWPEIQDDADPLDLDNDGLYRLDGEVDNPEKRAEKKKGAMGEKSNNKILLWMIWVLVIVVFVIVGWLFFFNEKPSSLFSGSQSEAFTKSSKLSLLEPLKGRYLVNRSMGKRVFILEGKLRNQYAPTVRVSKIRIVGALYNRKNEKTSEVSNFAGKLLTDDQLKQWPKVRIETFYSTAGTGENRTAKFEAGEEIPFQVVFLDIPDDIRKLEAKIERFVKSGN